MDAVDLFILNQMTSPRAILFGGLEPRTSPEVMAKRVGLTATSIRTRMSGWRTAGFLIRWHVVPHPAHFGMSHYVGHYRAATPPSRAALVETITTLEGGVAALHQVGGVVGVGIFAEDQERASETGSGVADVADVSCINEMSPVRLAPMERPWESDETELFRALRAAPDAPPAELAAKLGEAEKDVVERLEGLLQTGGMFFVPELDFVRFNGVLVRAMFDLDGDPQAAFDLLGQSHDVSFFRDVSTERSPRCHAMVHLRSVALLDNLEADVLALPGVSAVDFQFPSRFRVMTTWLDQNVPRLGR